HTPPPLTPTLFPYTTLFRSDRGSRSAGRIPSTDRNCARDTHALADQRQRPKRDRVQREHPAARPVAGRERRAGCDGDPEISRQQDRKSTRLNSSHVKISYAV